jgi:hypothetical protein
VQKLGSGRMNIDPTFSSRISKAYEEEKEKYAPQKELTTPKKAISSDR